MYCMSIVKYCNINKMPKMLGDIELILYPQAVANEVNLKLHFINVLCYIIFLLK